MSDRSVDVANVGESFSGDLSIWGLFLQADLVVKLVMLMLFAASIWSWTIIIEKRKALKKLNDDADDFEDRFWSGKSLDKLYQNVKDNLEDPIIKTFCSGMEEWQSGVASGLPAKENIQASLKQRVERAMAVTINRELHGLEKGMTFLATVGSTAPFIGLFGTVWGIMNSFSAIAGTQNTSLAVVAPGIAEALFATALGLVAAIPAVVAYNIYSNQIHRYADRLDAFVSEFSTILSRHLDKHKEVSANKDKSAFKKSDKAA
jgi:biopolymer transport protein TolQ